MFFFYAGARPEVRRVLQKAAEICPRCLSPASLVEYDTVFRVFSLPVYRKPGDNPAIFCENCKFLMPRKDYGGAREATSRQFPKQEAACPQAPDRRCWSCSASLSPEYKYCPFCGSPQT